MTRRRKTPQLPDLPPVEIVARDVVLGTLIAVAVGLLILGVTIALITRAKFG